MHPFKDAAGREWLVAINVNQVKAVRAAGIGVDLLALTQDSCKGLGELLGDPCRLVDTLYVLCREQCGAKSVTDKQFGELMLGETLEHAAAAFLGALTDFFPERAKRAALKKMRQATELVTADAMEELAKVTPEAIAAGVRKTLLQQTTSTA